jgi:biopolymer transport protein ExbD
MRCPSAAQHRDTPIDLPMTPMIDVVFQLLIFFVWTAGFQTTEYVLPGGISTATGAPAESERNRPPSAERDFDEVVIRILWSAGRPVWRLNETPLAGLAEVRSRLQAVAAIKSDAAVVVDPAGDVPLGHVIDVYDAARRAGFRQVQFATDEAL